MVPKSFRLMGQTFTVKIVPEKDWPNDDIVGLCLPNHLSIMIRADRPPEVQQQTFCHELVHAILEVMGRDKLSADEVFVDLFGSLLHQAWTTVEGEAPVTKAEPSVKGAAPRR